MTSNIFIIHGSFGSPFENWFPSTFDSMTELGIKTFVPHFPSPIGQTFENWTKIFDSYFELNLLNSNSIIVCHSSSCPFVLKYANYKRVGFKGLITVAGFNNFLSGDTDFDKINSEFYQDPEKLNLAGELFSFIHSFYSDNDPYIPINVLEEFISSINSTKHLIKNGGHLNKSSGFTSFPQLIELLTEKTK